MKIQKNVSAYDLHTRMREPVIDSMLTVQKDEKVLDLGSGTGYFAQKLLREGAATVCVDISRENLRVVVNLSNKGIIPVQATAAKLPFRDASFHAVLCSEVLEHMQSDSIVISEIARILRPRGMVVITVPCVEYKFPSLIELLGIKTVHDYEGPEKHYRKGYSVATLSRLLEQEGIRISHHEYFTFFLSQLLLDMISIAHLLVRKFKGQQRWDWADIQEMNSSYVFTIYKVIFPLLLALSKLDKIFSRFYRKQGTGLAVCAIKTSRA